MSLVCSFVATISRTQPQTITICQISDSHSFSFNLTTQKTMIFFKQSTCTELTKKKKIMTPKMADSVNHFTPFIVHLIIIPPLTFAQSHGPTQLYNRICMVYCHHMDISRKTARTTTCWNCVVVPGECGYKEVSSGGEESWSSGASCSSGSCKEDRKTRHLLTASAYVILYTRSTSNYGNGQSVSTLTYTNT